MKAGAMALGREAPVEIQLWDVGANPTDYGVHQWTARSAVEVGKRYAERGNPIMLDVEHLGAVSEGAPTPTAGYARLEMRAGAPWLVFDWSDFGREQIETGERRFLSSEYDVDKTTGEIVALYRVSLVADPGTHSARQLATAKGNPMDIALILAALKAALGAEDPAVAKESISNLVSQLESMAGTSDDAADPTEPVDSAAEDAGPPGAADDTKKEPMAAGADGAPPPADDEKKPVAAKAKASAPTAKPVASKAPIADAAIAAVAQIQNAQRDHLIATRGGDLDPAIRRWASAQPLAVVQGLIDATPAKPKTPTRATATRGSTNGTTEITAGAKSMLEQMGHGASSYRAPYRNEDGAFVYPTNRPTDVRAHIAAQAAKKEA